MTLNTLYHVVTDYGAIGDYNPTTDLGTDDTPAIAAAFAAATQAGGKAAVVFPGRRNYKITATLTPANGVMMMGIGHQHGFGSPGPPALIWRGAPGGTMIQVGTGSGGNFSNPFVNLQLVGGRDLIHISEWANTAIAFKNGVDSGTFLRDVWVGYCRSHALTFASSTNSYIQGGRFDRIAGYAIYHAMDTGNVFQQLQDLTYDNWDGAMGPPYSSGFLFLDGERASGSVAKVHLKGLHLEVNGPLIDTYATGVTPADRKGLIRLGIQAGANVQHMVQCDDLGVAAGSAVESFSVFQCTSVGATLAQHAAGVVLRITNGRTVSREPVEPTARTGNVKVFGNVSRAYTYQTPARINLAEFVRAGGPVDSERAMTDWYGVMPPTTGLLNLRPTLVANLPAWAREGDLAAVTDSTTATQGATIAGGGSNHVLAFHNGFNWTVR